MRGGRKKPNKADDIFFRLTLKDSFNAEIARGRKKYTYKDFNNRKYIFWREAVFKVNDILSTERLRSMFDEWFISGEIKLTTNFGDDVYVPIDYPSKKILKKYSRPFIQLALFGGISKEEFIEHIDKQWEEYQRLLTVQGKPKPKRIREIINKEKIRLVLKYDKYSTEELKEMLDIDKKLKGVYRENMIMDLLRIGGHELTPNAIKSIISTYRDKNQNRINMGG